MMHRGHVKSGYIQNTSVQGGSEMMTGRDWVILCGETAKSYMMESLGTSKFFHCFQIIVSLAFQGVPQG